MSNERTQYKTGPCSYCPDGGKPVLDWLKTVGPGWVDLPISKCWKVVKCSVCGCQGPMAKEEAEAVKLWNDRPGSACRICQHEGQPLSWGQIENKFKELAGIVRAVKTVAQREAVVFFVDDLKTDVEIALKMHISYLRKEQS